MENIDIATAAAPCVDENIKYKKINEIFFTYLDIGVAPVSKLTIFPSLYL